MENNIYGYIRISTNDGSQKIDRQVDALLKYVKQENLFIDRMSGKDFNRENYQILKRIAKKNDVVYVKSLDRMGRNKTQTKEELEYFRKQGIKIKVLDIPTTMQDFSQGQEWLFDMVNNILIEVYTTISENERRTIRERQKEGYDACKARGQKFGRPQAQKPKSWDKYYKLYIDGKITSTEFMRLVNLKKTTFYKFLSMEKDTKK
ncbi:recombinase family protein [Clostridium sp. 19966]|uniref:recombinase family protein n=1 Tax=Clostridium sp. 19966 TaxID=2768166 RepID=UPI0028DDEC07|nr:recombinase family protein [Clostridium sp. 19966]MDT8715234.1 recombinase family protein [Clostridium sp. 19966]